MTDNPSLDWVKSAEEELEIAVSMFKDKKYSHTLFFCHLALEKVLKALYIKKNDTFPLITHNLTKLAKNCGLNLPEEEISYLDEITTFNIEARYDVHKLRLHKKATLEFTKKYVDVTKKLFSTFKLTYEKLR